jgi:HlyD family secretion protein
MFSFDVARWMRLTQNSVRTLVRLGLLGVISLTYGCNNLIPETEAQPQPQTQSRGGVSVDAATAEVATLKSDRTYTGTTRPFREVSLRSQAEGCILDLTANVGDSVRQGETLGRLDNQIASSAVTQAESEVAARESEVASLQAEVEDARTQVERARLELQQARSDAARQNQLF